MGLKGKACINGITKDEAESIKEIGTIIDEIGDIGSDITNIQADISDIELQISNIKTEKWVELPFSNYSQFGRYNTKLYDSTTNKTKYDLQIIYGFSNIIETIFIGKDTSITKTIEIKNISYGTTKTYISGETFSIQNILTTLDDRIGQSSRTSIEIDNTTFGINIATGLVATPRESFRLFVFATGLNDI